MKAVQVTRHGAPGEVLKVRTVAGVKTATGC
jgi:hypothetical protein